MTDDSSSNQLLDLKQLQQSIEDTLRTVVTSSTGPAPDVALPLLQQVLPDVVGAEGRGRAGSSSLAASCLQAATRKLVVELASEAAKHGQPPLQHAARPGTEAALQRLLEVAVMCADEGMAEPSLILHMLDDLQDVSVMEHTLDIITWLEQHRAWLSAPGFKGSTQLTRLCNALFRRLGRHDVVNKARLLLLSASCMPLFDRSGVNVAGALAPADPPPIEQVPEDAVDSAGKPVNVALYQMFWSLQALLQDPVVVLKVTDNWNNFRKALAAVLTELSRSPATVAAVRTADEAAAAAAGGAGAGSDAGVSAAAAAAATAAAAGSGGQGATQCYLSSYKLFGLQLADSSFRRGFLVQVLIMLRCLLLPGKQPAETLKPKQRMEALDLEKQVYAVLDATPSRGKDFSRAVRDVLEREATWVEWKKGGKGFAVPGAAAPPAAPGGKKGGQPTQASCIDWTKPALAPMLAQVHAAHEAAGRKRKATEEARAEGLALKAEVEQLGRVYDRLGEPFEDPKYKRSRYIKLLGGPDASGLTPWCQQHAAAALAGAQPPLMAGLEVAAQPQYPLPQRLCAQLLREMDPEAGIEEAYKRVAEDPVYRWRIGRAVAQEQPEYEGGLITPDGLEGAMVLMLPSEVPPAYMAAFKEEAARIRAARAAKLAPRTAAGAAGAAKGQAQPPPGGSTATAAAGKAGAAGAGDGAEVAIKQQEEGEEEGQQQPAPAANGHVAAAADGAEDADAAGAGGAVPMPDSAEDADEAAADAAAAALGAAIEAEEQALAEAAAAGDAQDAGGVMGEAGGAAADPGAEEAGAADDGDAAAGMDMDDGQV